MEADLPLLVKEQDIGAALEESVGGGETGETASDDDNLSHYNAMYVGVEMVVGRISESRSGTSGRIHFIGVASRGSRYRVPRHVIMTPVLLPRILCRPPPGRPASHWTHLRVAAAKAA